MRTSWQPAVATPDGALAPGATAAKRGRRRKSEPGGRTAPGGTAAGGLGGRAGLTMTLPFMILYALFFLAPFLYSIVLSLRSPQTGAFVGLFNYRNAVGNGLFWSAVIRMAYFGAIQVTVMIVLAVVLALFLDSPYCLRRKAFGLIYFLPYAVPGVIAAMMWAFLLQPDLDNALKVPHLLGLASGPLNPLSYGFVLYAMMLIVTWEWTGYNMTILLTSLTSVPREVLESGKIDGASELSIAWRIKLPMIRRTIAFITIISIIGTLQLFNEPVVLNDIASMGSSYSPNQIIYNTAFSFGNEQLAAAQSIILALITVVATAVFYRIVRQRFGLAGTVRGAAR
ncbi:MAG TPA: sugar ABC transporter permease [Streptosporangiaceae bacterium]|nr:sugar ABC transporter permease [Streptosporangiaceae bacterium]